MKFVKPAAIAAIAALSLAAAGCGSGASEPTGDSKPAEVNVMVIESMTGPVGVDQTAPKGAEAAAKSIAAAGGANGITINVLSCDTGSDPNKSTQCAREAVQKKAIAVVGAFDPFGVNAMLPVLEQAGIPYVGPLATGDIEFQSPVSFPLTAGAPGGTYATIPAAVDAGCASAAMWSDTAIDAGLGQNVVDSLIAEGVDATLIPLSSTQTDVTPVVAQALALEPDCVVYASAGSVGVQLFSAVRAAGSSAKIITAYGSFQEPFLQAMGAEGDGIIATSDSPLVTDPALQPFRDDLAEYAPDVEYPTQFTLNAWYAVQTVGQALDGMTDSFDTTGLLKHLSGMDTVKLDGLAEFSFTKELTGTKYPRMFNPTYQLAVAEGGAYVSTDATWHEVTEYLPAK